MRRRDFIAGLGGAVAFWPVVARAQKPTIPVIGVLELGPPSSYDLTGFQRGLKEAGYVEGQNLVVEYRWGNEEPARLPELATDLVHRRVAVIVAFASSLPVRAAMAATSEIPIVFGFGGDPVQQGVVASLSRPGGNVTGMTSLSGELVGKQLEILHEVLPEALRFGILSNPNSLVHEVIVKDAQNAASAIGGSIEVLRATSDEEIDAVFARLLDNKRLQGLLVSNDPLYLARAPKVAQAADRIAVPAIFPFREQAKSGGLMSYGPSLFDRDRGVGNYVGRILKGDRPSDLPVEQSAKFELAINMKTAKALNLTVPHMLLARADEVIE